jgi:isoquinoline 1-oxidoreductase beta subunit
MRREANKKPKASAVALQKTISRRDFIKVVGTAGGSLVIGIYLNGCAETPTETLEATSPPTLSPTWTTEPATTQEAEPTDQPTPSAYLDPNIYLSIDNLGQVTVTAFRSEMGQGIRTAIAMLVAEELDVDWSVVSIQQALADPAYGDQVTGGSASISGSHNTLRRGGAAARQMLVTAAAQGWEVSPDECSTESGWVIHPDGEQRLPYGDLVEAAAELDIPLARDVQLKDPADFRILGTGIGHWDAPDIVTGKAIYGIDVKLPGMLYATVARCPVFGGKVSVFDANQAQAVAGVRQVIEINTGIAVVAENTWAAIRGREALEIIWDEGGNADLSTESIRERFANRVPALGSAEAGTLEAIYEIPFEAHATMSPMNCVADVQADRCEVWAPTQNAQQAKWTAMSITNLPKEAIQVHVPLLGGGFGRRLEVDYVGEAVRISKAVGAPVQVLWTRQDDLQHDFYHPMTVRYASAPLDTPTNNPRVHSQTADGIIPTGAWRSVGNFPEAFVRQSFIDEFAAATGQDPLVLRLELYSGRARDVIELAANQSGWGEPLPDGWGRGIAYHATFGVTHVAQVAEVSVDQNGTIRVHRVVCAVDCGLVVNSDTVKAQMEGGIVFGLTAALKAQATVENGRVQQDNFHNYPLLRMDEMPNIEVHILKTDNLPSGIGEMGVPPIAPAVANAVFAATGKRIRRIPIRPEDLRE